MTGSPIPWSAQWIRSNIQGGARVTAPVPFFRKTFRIDEPVRSAALHITALGLYECQINGQCFTENIFAPGWTDYHRRIYFQTYDVSGVIQQGENAIGVILGDGWYAGHIGRRDRGCYGDRPQLLAQLEIVAARQTKHWITTDASWKTTVGPILESDLIMGESYDARRELGDWCSAEYDDKSWNTVELAPDPKIIIEYSPGPPVRRQEILAGHAIEVKAAGNGKILFDFGQNLIGRVRLTIRGERGIRLGLRHAEILDNDSLYTDNLRTARAADYYTLKGGGEETWEPHFTFHGFRFLEIVAVGGPAPIYEKVEAVVIHSDTPLTGEFECSNALLNRLSHNILWSQKGNFLEVPTDCPQRDERLGWTGDAQVFARTAAFYMDVRTFFHKWLKDLRDAQGPAGEIPFIAPNSFPGPIPDAGPAWGDAVFICPWTIYRCYGDVEIVRDNYDCMARYLAFLGSHRVQNYIRAHPDVDNWGGFGDWLALDGSGRRDGGTPKDLIGTAFYANAAHIMAQAAALLGKDSDAKWYAELHTSIVAAFQNRFVTPDGLLASGTQTAYVLALHFHLLPPMQRRIAANELVRAIKRNNMHLATGFVGTPYLLHVLEAEGNLDVAYQLLEQEEFPSWLFPVKNGATTIWERWDGWTPEKGFQDKAMNSFNHYAYGAVGDWMISTLAGLEIGSPGYKQILFKPRPGGTITWAEAKLMTPQGQAAIRWELTEAKLNLALSVPEGSEGRLSLPDGWSAEIEKLAPGRHEVIATRQQ